MSTSDSSRATTVITADVERPVTASHVGVLPVRMVHSWAAVTFACRRRSVDAQHHRRRRHPVRDEPVARERRRIQPVRGQRDVDAPFAEGGDAGAAPQSAAHRHDRPRMRALKGLGQRRGQRHDAVGAVDANRVGASGGGLRSRLPRAERDAGSRSQEGECLHHPSVRVTPASVVRGPLDGREGGIERHGKVAGRWARIGGTMPVRCAFRNGSARCTVARETPTCAQAPMRRVLHRYAPLLLPAILCAAAVPDVACGSSGAGGAAINSAGGRADHH